MKRGKKNPAFVIPQIPLLKNALYFEINRLLLIILLNSAGKKQANERS